MSTINIAQECGCFKRSALENNVTFDNKDDAMMKAQGMLSHMNEKFCGKHGFELSEDGDNFAIMMKAPQAAASGGCCGGGHCS